MSVCPLYCFPLVCCRNKSLFCMQKNTPHVEWILHATQCTQKPAICFCAHGWFPSMEIEPLPANKLHIRVNYKGRLSLQKYFDFTKRRPASMPLCLLGRTPEVLMSSHSTFLPPVLALDLHSAMHSPLAHCEDQGNQNTEAWSEDTDLTLHFVFEALKRRTLKGGRGKISTV